MLPKTITIDTDRLILQEVTPELYDLVMSTYSNDDISRFFGYRTDGELLKEKERHAKGINNYYQSFKRFVLVDREQKQAIGQCGYHKWYEEHSRAELGYALYDKNMMNRGYMREAVAPIVAYGFNNMLLNRIEAFIGPRNTASIKLVEKLGFQHEGVLREHYVHNGTPEDSTCYALLRKEFNTAS